MIGELQLITETRGPIPAYQDGDILVACNGERTRCVHTEHLVDHRKESRVSAGLLVTDCWCAYFNDLVYEYRFERVSETEVKRVTLATMAEEIFGPAQIDVPQYVAYAMSQTTDGAVGPIPKQQLFGSPGREIWYGGGWSPDMDKLNAMWDRIEDDSPNRRTQPQFERFPWGSGDLTQFLVIPTDDFDRPTMSSLVASEAETVDSGTENERQVILQKRLRKANYAAMAIGVSLADIRDPSITVDIRDTVAPFSRDAVVQVKPNAQREDRDRIVRGGI